MKSIDHIQKPLTNGIIDLIAWDYKRQCNGPTFIGHYEPTETEPMYRRIKIGYKNAPIRIRFRRRNFVITSYQDWLPFTSMVPVLTMCKAVHYLRKDFIEQYDLYKKEADKLLQEEQTAREGPEEIKLQFNDPLFGDQGGKFMDTGWSGDVTTYY